MTPPESRSAARSVEFPPLSEREQAIFEKWYARAPIAVRLAYWNRKAKERSRMYQPAGKATAKLVHMSNKIHSWRFLTGGRRAELILMLDDVLAEVQRLEAKLNG